MEQYQFIPNATAYNGHTVLHIACEEGHLSVVKYLLTSKSVLDTVTARDHSGRTAMELVYKNKYEVFSQFTSHVDLKMELPVKAFFKLFMAGNE